MRPKLTDVLRRRFPFLFWPLVSYRDRILDEDAYGALSRHLGAARYSLRLQRYWWAACKINDEADRTRRIIVVVDLGCERGWLKRFTGEVANVRWVGLDGNTDRIPLQRAGYHEVRTCNFNEPLPLPDAFADVVVSLHVFEHLRDPHFTATEVARILKPGGVFLAGTPASPAPIAAIRTWILKARDRMGRNRHWGHLRKFSPASWCNVCMRAGLRLEFLTGSHLIRRTGSRLENHRWWVRLNQLWGGLFPSLGQEAYLAARKPVAGAASASGWMDRLWLRFDWAAPTAALAALAIMLVTMNQALAPHPLADEIALQQDGNDVFCWCPLSQPTNADDRGGLDVLPRIDDAAAAFNRFAARGRDLHVIAHAEHAAAYLNSPIGPALRVANEWREGEQRYVVLSMEAHDTPLAQYLSPRSPS